MSHEQGSESGCGWTWAAPARNMRHRHDSNIIDYDVGLNNSRDQVDARYIHRRIYIHRLPLMIIIMNFYSPVSNTRCHSIGHKMRIARIKIRVDSQWRWEGA